MTYSTIPKPVDRGEWLKARHPYWNASDAAVLYSEHPFRSLADVAVEKLQPEPTDDGTNDAMDRGQRLEPILLDWIGDTLGCAIEVPQTLYINDRLMATLDGIPVGSDDTWVEAKTSSKRYDEPADYWMWQIAAQAAATGRSRCICVWIDADMRFKWEEVEPHPDHIADVLERACRFMEWIDLGLLPEGIELRSEHVAQMFPKPVDGKFVDVDDEGLDAIVRWEHARQARIAAEKAEAEAKDAVARIAMDAEGVRHDGRLVLTWKANKDSERLDVKALEANEPDVVARYRRTAPGPRVLRATKALTADEFDEVA